MLGGNNRGTADAGGGNTPLPVPYTHSGRRTMSESRTMGMRWRMTGRSVTTMGREK